MFGNSVKPVKGLRPRHVDARKPVPDRLRAVRDPLSPPPCHCGSRDTWYFVDDAGAMLVCGDCVKQECGIVPFGGRDDGPQAA